MNNSSNILNIFIEYLRRPVRFDYLLKILKYDHLRILDIGCGNHSPSLTKKYLGECQYHGLDISKEYNYHDSDFGYIDNFFQIDLNNSKLDEIPDFYYDCIIFSQVIEHLPYGLDTLNRLISKLKMGGIIYIETPSPKSLKLPKMKGTLNFWDDQTHKRIYPMSDLIITLKNNNCEIMLAKTRRSFKRILFLPIYIIYDIWKYGFISGTAFWDLLGFANVVFAKRVVAKQ